ncbi:MAG: hypothetical protein ABIA59_07695 [Candidatus Latescibacterota bacterium]
MKTIRLALGATKWPAVTSMIFVLAFSLLQCGSSKEYADPAQNLLATSVKALGGEKKACNWTTRIDRGILTTERPGWGTLQAKCTLTVQKPDKMKFDQDYSAYDHPFFYTFYYNEGDVWLNVNLGIRQHQRYTTLIENKMRRIDGPAYFLAECDTFFLVTDIPDDSLITASSIDRVGVVDGGDTVLFDIDKETHLPVRRIQDSGTTIVLLADYRKVAGIKLPFKETVYQSGSLTSYQWDDIEFNMAIDETIFDEGRPPAVEEQETE